MGAYQSVLVPGDGLLLVGIGILEASDGTSLAAEQTVKVRSDLVSLALLEGVALGASGLEEVGTLLNVTYEWIVSKILISARTQEQKSPYIYAQQPREQDHFSSMGGRVGRLVPSVPSGGNRQSVHSDDEACKYHTISSLGPHQHSAPIATSLVLESRLHVSNGR